MNSDTWEFENNICRCCHAEGFFFNLAEPRPFCGEMEVYADMMKDVFNIEVRPMPGALCELTYTICTSCVFKLREAIQFKKQVQSCEDRFLNLFFKNKLKVMKKAEIAKVKEEPDIDFKEEYLELDIDFDSNNDAELDDDANEDSKNHNLKSLLTATPTPIKKEKGKQKATPEKKAAPAKTRKQVGKKKVLVKKKGVARNSHIGLNEISDIEMDTINKAQLKPTITPKAKLKNKKNNVLQVLTKSTAMPFRWYKNWYGCFYCHDMFRELNDFKNHQETHGGDEIKEEAVHYHTKPVVYVDVSNLSCKLCTENIEDLQDLIDHLIAKHEVLYDKDAGVCMVAFKLDTFFAHYSD